VSVVQSKIAAGLNSHAHTAALSRHDTEFDAPRKVESDSFVSSCMYPSNSRQNGLRDLSRSPNGLPVFTPSIHEKKLRHPKPPSWTISLYLPIPGLRNRHLHIILPNLPLFHRFTLSHFSRRRGTLFLFITCVSIVFTIFAIVQRIRAQEKQWAAPLFPGDPPTLVFGREDLQKIWRWEVQSGHYPSSRDSTFFAGTYVRALTPFFFPP
jgi:DDB1- and CUL4-associated factor 13